VTHTYIQAMKKPTLHYLTRSVRRRAASFKSASVELSKFLDSVGVLRPGVPQMSGCVLLNLKSERVAGELFRTLDVVEKMVDERGFEPPASSLRTRKNLS
jgi:hypothetical protein